MAGAVHTSVYKAGSGEFSPTALLSRFMRQAAGWPLLSWRFSGRAPAHLLYAPFDMHLADPKLAHEFYHGRFPLGGRIVQAGATSPFLVEPPSREWEEALYDFSWLNHMTAAETELAAAHARALTLDWIELEGRKPAGRAWAAALAARRLIAWLAHGEALFAGAAPAFRKRFLKIIGLHIRYLRVTFAGEKDDIARLYIAVALAMAALCAPASAGKAARKAQLKAHRRLEKELARQILPDGGHISRNPAIILELLIYLLPLQYAYTHCLQAPPPLLVVAIDRLLPALRFFRHCDGTLANFNGVGPILAQRLDIVLNAVETVGAPFSQAPHSGYQRLTGGDTVVLADTGAPLAKRLTETANAGCLSFEMSSGRQRFIVNCGLDPYGPAEFRFFGRLTAAHSTATIADTSSCRFARGDRPLSGFAGRRLHVRTARIEEEDMQGFIAAHDGYKQAFSLIHERALTLSRNGNVLQGCDRFYEEPERAGLWRRKSSHTPAVPVAVRFHVHPDIGISHEGAVRDEASGQEHDIIRLQGDYGESWIFSADCPVRLEDSIYFSGLGGPAKTQQYVLNFSTAERDRVQWSFRRETA
ncbi:heparinase II/III family protein [Candidatus Tokpelaia sp.]|uniref:heparinase II/III family protein n=1 Tax=Candidatus Tokpelaia sp. TaxID=2233777 RepID=UPI001FF01694|nr:heparinase II/III family protein [Candidatus Tokpelaia sp.]